MKNNLYLLKNYKDKILNFECIHQFAKQRPTPVRTVVSPRTTVELNR